MRLPRAGWPAGRRSLWGRAGDKFAGWKCQFKFGIKLMSFRDYPSLFLKQKRARPSFKRPGRRKYRLAVGVSGRRAGPMGARSKAFVAFVMSRSCFA